MKSTWEKLQGPLGREERNTLNNLPHPWTFTTNRSHHYRQQFQHHRKGGLGAGQDHQGINIHKGKQSYFEPKHW